MRVNPTLETSEVQSGPASDRRPSRRWLDMLDAAGADQEVYQGVCERIEGLYADLAKLARVEGDPEFSMFWANLEVLRPSIYSRPPVPVVSERFSDRRPVVRKSAEVLERALITVTAETDLHGVLKQVRDDLSLYARGVPWVRLVDGSVEFEHVDREDFRHDPARKWSECGWVARRAHLSEDEVTDLFGDLDEDDREKLGFRRFVDEREIAGETKAQVWEIWHKGEGKVVHVADGLPRILKEGTPPVEVKGFFPCPRPAFGTLTPRRLVPVPDMVYYRDQLDEINRITARIAALSDLIKMKGFYDASAGDTRTVIETAFRQSSDAALLVGVPNLSKLVTQGSGQLIEWFPTERAAQTVQALVGVRRQLIEDVYQITGLSDIMRGATVASETATAQQLKAQYGGVRIRERQEEMVRIARDLYRIAAEMLAERVGVDRLLEMAQVYDLPDQDEMRQQAASILQQAAGDPQAMQQAEAQVAQIGQQVTRQAVIAFLSNERLRPFALDIETDSTIQPNEDAEKQRRTEFLTAISGSIGSLMQLVGTEPAAADFAAAILRFTANGFRAGRELQQPIDDFAEMISARAKQPQGPSPEQQAAEAEAQMKQAEGQREDALAQAEIALRQADAALKQAQAVKTQAEAQAAQIAAQRSGEEWADGQFANAMAAQATSDFDAAMRGAAR